MKILCVNKFHWPKGGAERVYFDLARRYEQAGHEVVPFSMQSPENEPSPWSRFFVPHVDYGGAAGFAAARAAAGSVYSPRAKQHLERLLREFRPDVAHLHNFHHQLSPSIVDALREAAVPAVHTLHDYKVICPNYLLYTEGQPCERCVAGHAWHAVRYRCVRGRRAASLVAAVETTWHRKRRTLERGIRCFVSPSRFLAGKLAASGVPEDRVRVIPNGIEPRDFPPADGPGEGFVYAGRLSREKGLDTLLAAMERVPAAHLDVYGTGPEERRLRRLAEARLGDRVRFAGFQGREALLERLHTARAVILPSEWYENAPLSALEALACGVPVIASRMGGLPEIVREDRTGLLFPAGDDRALSQALEKLTAHPGLAHELGRAGRKMIESEYSLEGQTQAMLDLFAEVTSSASR